MHVHANTLIKYLRLRETPDKCGKSDTMKSRQRVKIYVLGQYQFVKTNYYTAALSEITHTVDFSWVEMRLHNFFVC